MPETIRALGVLATAALAAAGCGPSGRCEPRMAVVTDIDETLTTQDTEYLAQFTDPTHDPAERPDASELMQAYDELGYVVFYVTARGADLELPDGRSARRATEDWLDAHGFPFETEAVYLAERTIFGSAAVDYKEAVLEELAAEGWRFEYAYGNADTDIEAFRLAGIPDERIFHVGRTAGEIEGVVPVPDDEAYAAHLADHLPGVPAATCD